MRYNKGSLDSTLNTAQKLVLKGRGQTAYVFPTALGWLIAWAPPPFRLAHYKVSPHIELIDPASAD